MKTVDRKMLMLLRAHSSNDTDALADEAAQTSSKRAGSGS
jgi:hypothetical protein